MLYIGDLVNTHGIKGEVRIISSFKYKDIVFKINNYLYIDNLKLKITSYRKHKNFDMVTFEGYDNINDVLKFKGKKVYNNGKYIGVLEEIIKGGSGELLVVRGVKKYLIPYVDEFILNIGEDINLNLIEGLIDEN